MTVKKAKQADSLLKNVRPLSAENPEAWASENREVFMDQEREGNQGKEMIP
jgi:hypothetical protein